MRFFLGLVLVVLMLIFAPKAQAQQYKWVKTGGTNQNLSSAPQMEGSYYTTTDANGNVYSLNLVGNNPIYADTFYRSSAYGANNNVLLTSYDCFGNMRWAKLLGSYADQSPMGLTTDSLGHVYICGIFPHGVLHIGNDTTIPSSSSQLVAALIQFDTSGHYNWIRFVGTNTPGNQIATTLAYGALAIDGQQNIHFLKFLLAGAQLSPTVTSHYGTYDLKYDVSGTLLSATQLQLDSIWTIGRASIDKYSQTLYAIGYSNGAFPFYGNYVAAFDINRNRIWLDSMYDITSPGAGGFTGVATDNVGHLYLSATGTGTISFRGDTVYNTLLPSGGATSIIVKADTSGNPLWMKCYSGSLGVNWFNDFTLMPGNKMAATGVMAGMVTCDGTTVTSFAGEGQNSFFTILDTAGFVHSIQQIHGSGFYDGATAISSDRVGNLFVGGQFASNVWGGPLAPATSIGGNTDFFVIKYGVSCGCTSMPLAAFSHSGNPLVSFSYSGTTAAIDSVRWNFGDGGTASSFSTAHAYTSPGTYIASVSIYSACGSDIRFASIYIPCVAPPVTAFTMSGTSAIRNFSYTGTPAAPDSVVWNFGDGTHATGMSVSHTYTSIGVYNACATAYTQCGNNTVCHAVTITCTTSLIPAFTHSGYSPVSFAYTGTTAGLDSVVWHYGDGGHSSGMAGSHAYAASGTYTPCALVYSQCGIDSSCNTFTLPCVSAPVASFTHTGSPVVSFTYTGTTTIADSIVWQYGDGLADTGMHPVHTYALADRYHVCVTVYSPCGSDIACLDVITHGVGIPAISLNSINVYPNPANDALNISGVQEPTRFRLLTVAGMTLQQGLLQQGFNKIGMLGYASGIYMIELTADDGSKKILRVIKE